MPSLKEIANCMWVGAGALPVPFPPPSPFSVVRHFFGYTAQGYTGPLSVKEQIRLLQGRHVHLNMIRVGVENFITVHREEIDQALERMRAIYATVGVGVGRVLPFFITEAEANESMVFQSMLFVDGFADFLTNSWTVHNNAMDIFLLLQYELVPTGVIGRSATDGPCDKDDTCVMTGSVISLLGGPRTGLLLAHEAGHYIGLPHINNLSAQSVDIDQDGVIDPLISASSIANVMFPIITAGSTNLTMVQGAQMMVHCFTRSGC